jgi:hypothetical protein
MKYVADSLPYCLLLVPLVVVFLIGLFASVFFSSRSRRKTLPDPSLPVSHSPRKPPPVEYDDQTVVITAVSLPVFVVIHGAVSLFVLCLAFVSAEQGDSSAVPLAVLGLILAPFLILTNWLQLPAALPVGILCSSLFWWFVSLKFILLIVERTSSSQSDQEDVTDGCEAAKREAAEDTTSKVPTSQDPAPNEPKP